MSKSIATKRLIRSSGTTVSPPDRKSSDEGQEQYVGSFAALIDKYVQYTVSGKGIPFCIVLVVMGSVFYQDNRAGELRSWGDLLWTIQKCSFPVALYLIFIISRFGSRLINKRHGQENEKLRRKRKD